MNSNCRFLATILGCCLLAACGTMQSIVRSSIPYTTTLTVPASAQTGKSLSAVGTASSFDKVIFKNGNINRVNAVKVASAELQSALPADFDLGHLQNVKVYMMKPDESAAVLVASKDNIPPGVTNVIGLVINDSALLDRFIREPDIRIKMVYTLRNQVKASANLLLVMNVNATPINAK
jgi:hypothetical protein